MRFGIEGEVFESDEMYEIQTGGDGEPILYVPKTRNAVYIVRCDHFGVAVVRASMNELASLVMRYDFLLLRQVVETLAKSGPVAAVAKGSRMRVSDSIASAPA